MGKDGKWAVGTIACQLYVTVAPCIPYLRCPLVVRKDEAAITPQRAEATTHSALAGDLDAVTMANQ